MSKYLSILLSVMATGALAMGWIVVAFGNRQPDGLPIFLFISSASLFFASLVTWKISCRR